MQIYPPGTRKGNRTCVLRVSVDGRQHEKVLAATTLAAAKKEAGRFVDSIKGRDPAALVRFEEAARAYLDFKRPRRDDEACIDRLIRWFRDKPVQEIVSADLHAAANALLPKAQNATKNRSVITPASAVLHYAAEQKWCSYSRHSRFRVSRRSPRKPATDETMRLLLANTSGHKHLLLAWLYETGTRISDSLRLRRDDLDLPHAVARVGSSKTDEVGEIGLSPELVAMLANATPLPGGRVFPWRDRHGVYRWLRPLCRRLGVSYTPHLSRHAMATALRGLGWDMQAIAERGIWRDPRSAERYVHRTGAAAPPARGVVVILGDRRGTRGPKP